MVQVDEQPIRVGNHEIGTVAIVGGAVTGQGGALHPQLIVPLTIDVDKSLVDATIATIRIKATLAAK